MKIINESHYMKIINDLHFIRDCSKSSVTLKFYCFKYYAEHQGHCLVFTQPSVTQTCRHAHIRGYFYLNARSWTTFLFSPKSGLCGGIKLDLKNNFPWKVLRKTLYQKDTFETSSFVFPPPPNFMIIQVIHAHCDICDIMQVNKNTHRIEEGSKTFDAYEKKLGGNMPQ